MMKCRGLTRLYSIPVHSTITPEAFVVASLTVGNGEVKSSLKASSAMSSASAWLLSPRRFIRKTRGLPAEHARAPHIRDQVREACC